jgi:hypothetical protein
MSNNIQEQQYINANYYNEDDNYELHLKQRKFAKFYIFFGIVGIFAGVSASICFLFAYNLIQAPIFAFCSGIFLRY